MQPPRPPVVPTLRSNLKSNFNGKRWYKDVARTTRLWLFVSPRSTGPVCVPGYVSDCISKQCDNAMKVFRLKLLKRQWGRERGEEGRGKKNTPVAGFCSSLSLIPLLQNASLVTADSQAPLINAPNENVWLWVAECDCLKPLGFWCNPTEDAGVTPDF